VPSVKRNQLLLAAVALVVTQVVHGAVPGDGEEEAWLGLVLGALGLLASIVVLVGLVRNAPWASWFAALTGATIAVGFVLYHGLPFKSSLNNPYWGSEGSATGWQWLTVVAVLAASAGTVWFARLENEPAPAGVRSAA
jgi:hypothetical protein